MIARRLKSPVRVDLVLNADCNHMCSHCYNPWRANPLVRQNLNGRAFKECLKHIVSELVKAEVWSVILTGGEPLLHPQECFYAIDLLKANDIDICLNTNLTCMTDKLASQLVADHNWSNIILASLPAITPACCDEITKRKGSFDAIIKGIDVCKRHGIRVGINTVITKKNISELDKYLNFIKAHPVEYLSISIAIPPVYDLNNEIYHLSNQDIRLIADTLLEIRSKYGIDIGSVTPLPLCLLLDADKYMPIRETMCLAGITKCSIHVVDGRVTACAHEDCSYGNIYTESLISCWNKMGNWVNGDFLAKECKRCKWLFLCGGECRMMQRGNLSSFSYHLDSSAQVSFRATSNNFLTQVEEHEFLHITPNLRVRKEPMGYLIKADYIETYVSEKLWLLCEKLNELGVFSKQDLWKALEHNPEAEKIISILIHRKILKRV